MTVAEAVADGILVCPVCHGRLAADLACAVCGYAGAVVDGIPVLLPPDSAFQGATTIYFAPKVAESPAKRRLRRSLPALAFDHDARATDELVRRELRGDRGLVVGAGERPGDIEARFPGVRWLTTDVDGAFRPHLVADALSLPVADASQDLVVAEMVLEHLMDPGRGAAELQRVCRPGGLILIKVPFCFPWHGIPIDFFRITPSGVRALFRATDVVHLGRCMGPFGALAYQLDSTLVNLASSRTVRRVLMVVSRFLFGWLKALDRLAGPHVRWLVSSAGVTYVGRKVESPYGAAEILAELQERFGRGP
ncbi:MAG TPA: methyltransferase domain-containing protein [Thermoanaerobaculia bacterium]|nr:methyltransferase domain-containing protein [Thermoanaerobaculia bacterium]